MKITILDKRDAVIYKPEDKAVIIRIGDVYPLNKLKYKYIDECKYFFSDTNEFSEYSIQKDEAIEIAKFILKYINEVDEIVIHCVYGQGRSPAIAAVIYNFLDDKFDFSKYKNINKYVYNEINEAIIKLI